MDERSRAACRRALLRWFDRCKRDLPWRRSRDPYRTWVAEVMLQQTRIAVVIPAYRRFVRAFPTLRRLARAAEDDVLSLWSGLGYYSRARSLHCAARLLHESDREFPRTWAAARALPGVGDYTAAAVLSIAYGEAHAAVDGNVIRVLSRLRRWSRPNGRGEPHRSFAEALLSRRRPGDWNQAVMELGETVCLPKSPLCGECPVARWCEAFAGGAAEAYPGPKARRGVERLALHLTVVRDRDDRILLERGAFPHLRHMWLPLAGLTPRRSRSRFKHAILHREFEVEVEARVLVATDIRLLLRAPDGVERRLFTADELRRIGRSALLTKALAAVETM